MSYPRLWWLSASQVAAGRCRALKIIDPLTPPTLAWLIRVIPPCQRRLEGDLVQRHSDDTLSANTTNRYTRGINTCALHVRRGL
jgi:hypothetical protein